MQCNRILYFPIDVIPSPTREIIYVPQPPFTPSHGTVHYSALLYMLSEPRQQYYYCSLPRQSKQALTTFFLLVDIVMTDDFIMTIDSEGEGVSVPKQLKGKRKAAETGDEPVALDASFSFDLTGDAYADVLHEEAIFQDVVKAGSKPVRRLLKKLPRTNIN